ncbi:MAG: hypothetical protein EBT47_08560 [Chloroflexi bacterium]|nr:hypothetical protein [Chloroflexota bacterium]
MCVPRSCNRPASRFWRRRTRPPHSSSSCSNNPSGHPRWPASHRVLAHAKRKSSDGVGLPTAPSPHRIGRSHDGASNQLQLAVSEKLKNQVRGLNQAQRNAQDGISLIQTAEGALTETHSLLARMRELAVQAANDTLQDADRANLQVEFTALYAEVDRIAAATTFNGTYLLNNQGIATGMTFQIGAFTDNTITLTLGGAKMTSLNAAFNTAAASLTTIGSQTQASRVISALDTAVDAVSTARAGFRSPSPRRTRLLPTAALPMPTSHPA